MNARLAPRTSGFFPPRAPAPTRCSHPEPGDTFCFMRALPCTVECSPQARGWARRGVSATNPTAAGGAHQGSEAARCPAVVQFARRSSMRNTESHLPVASRRPADARPKRYQHPDEPRHRAPVASTGGLLRELVTHLRQHRDELRDEWAKRIIEARLLTAMSHDEVVAEATSVYDNYLDALETGTLKALQAYARNLSERIIPRGVETAEVVGIVLLLRDVLARWLFVKYRADVEVLSRVLDAYEPAANRIAITVAAGFVQERERVIREQQEAIRELSTPVLPVRERLLILPIIGLIDPQRARQLTEQLLRGIRTNRAKVVVIDITGVAAMDASVANHLVQTVEAARLLGATVIVTGLSPEIAQTLVNIGVDLGKMNTVGDLQGGIEEAERLLGYRVVPKSPDGPEAESV